ncbi:hypothetical protein LMH87_010058 [Akanthomyces muscarius]|uniref:Uncharacterized protein n=1 Tax=Akanthomyces muscarius TaxID=2231603 RepID=A0A9W8QCJ9_AKAMU|nr:hypothetical protein LMH87_010058 [Akanthomyces muscarius]KAJ4153575.1 hypothetical protein LMH87_010058 [Akanthomyces muscarius]
MVKINTICLAMMAAAAPLAEARNCNKGLLYCGNTLLAIGNYRAQIDDAVAKAGIRRFKGDDLTTDSLFKCLGGSNGDIEYTNFCRRGCQNGGSGKNDFC